MRRFILAFGISLLAATAFAHGRHGRNFSTDDGAAFGDCSSNRITFDGERAAMQKVDVPVAGLGNLRVRSGNGALSVRGGSGWSIVACKAAEDMATLREIDVRLSGGELSASGPRGDDEWMIVYYVTAPRGAHLEIDGSNGPVSLRDVDGDLNVRQKNGPLSLHHVSGDVDAVTTNGPISLTGGSGRVRVTATNGPLTVKLAGGQWNGTLDASTKNGPLSVSIPRGYGSRVKVEALGHGPVSCRAEGCESARMRLRSDGWDDDEPRAFAFGSGPETVRLSTVNGPLTIRESDE